jgi:hypothetical protein
MFIVQKSPNDCPQFRRVFRGLLVRYARPWSDKVCPAPQLLSRGIPNTTWPLCYIDLFLGWLRAYWYQERESSKIELPWEVLGGPEPRYCKNGDPINWPGSQDTQRASAAARLYVFAQKLQISRLQQDALDRLKTEKLVPLDVITIAWKHTLDQDPLRRFVLDCLHRYRRFYAPLYMPLIGKASSDFLTCLLERFVPNGAHEGYWPGKELAPDRDFQNCDYHDHEDEEDEAECISRVHNTGRQSVLRMIERGEAALEMVDSINSQCDCSWYLALDTYRHGFYPSLVFTD